MKNLRRAHLIRLQRGEGLSTDDARELETLRFEELDRLYREEPAKTMCELVLAESEQVAKDIVGMVCP